MKRNANDPDTCFACGKPITSHFDYPGTIETSDGQRPWVGRECFRKIKKAGEAGYQTPKGGPRIYWRPEKERSDE